MSKIKKMSLILLKIKIMWGWVCAHAYRCPRVTLTLQSYSYRQLWVLGIKLRFSARVLLTAGHLSIPKVAAMASIKWLQYIFEDVHFILLHPFVHSTHAVRGQLASPCLYCVEAESLFLLLYRVLQVTAAPSFRQFTCLCLLPWGKNPGNLDACHCIHFFPFLYACICALSTCFYMWMNTL